MSAHNKYLVEQGLVDGTVPVPVKLNANLEADVIAAHTEIKSFVASIVAFPNTGGTVSQVLAIHEATVHLGDVVKSATNNARGIPSFTDILGNLLIGASKILIPDIQRALTTLIAKKAQLETVLPGVHSMVAEDLRTLKQDIGETVELSLQKMPIELLGAVQKLTKTLDDLLQEAVSAFS